MCGIVGYIGEEQAAPILLDGLSKLEYRGYDSAGIAVEDEGEIHICKSTGRLKVLSELTHDGAQMPGHIGIGHTRWATHGAPTDQNAHPHQNKDGSIVLVHNGIIENYMKLKQKLLSKGYEFVSDTDTEVVTQLLDYYYQGDPMEALIKVMSRVEGSYALGILFKDFPDQMYAIRKDSPLVLGKGKQGNLIASDVPAILKYTRDVYYIENEEIAILEKDNIRFYNIDREEIEKELHTVEWDVNAAEKGGYEHFMLKEMYEQPKAVRDTLEPRLKDGKIVIEELGMTDDEIRAINSIHIIACGSASYAGTCAKYIFEEMARIPSFVDLASEFRYRNPILHENDLVIIISQSGETADSLAALREAKEKGAMTLAIVNVVGSSIAREADKVIYTWAGPEIAVATTKAFSTQLIAEYLLAIKFAEVRNVVTEEVVADMIQDLKRLPDQIQMLLANRNHIQKFANRYVAARDVFFIGRGLDYALSMEGALKLKEISYIHAEAYAAGELKHGTISLVEDGTLVVAVLTQEALFKKTISNIQEVKSRGAFAMAVTVEGNTEIEKTADYVIYIPETNRYFTSSLALIPLQLFAYYVAVGRGCDVDKPKNLAKSVTVE